MRIATEYVECFTLDHASHEEVALDRRHSTTTHGGTYSVFVPTHVASCTSSLHALVMDQETHGFGIALGCVPYRTSSSGWSRVPWFSLLMFSRPENGWAASDEDGKKRCAAEMPVGMSGGRSSTPPCFSPCAYLTPPSDPSADESPRGTSDDAIASPSPRLVAPRADRPIRSLKHTCWRLIGSLPVRF